MVRILAVRTFFLISFFSLLSCQRNAHKHTNLLIHAFFENEMTGNFLMLGCEYVFKNLLLGPKQSKSVIARRSISVKSSKCDKHRLRPACAYAQLIRAFASRLNILGLLSY